MPWPKGSKDPDNEGTKIGMEISIDLTEVNGRGGHEGGGEESWGLKLGEEGALP